MSGVSEFSYLRTILKVIPLVSLAGCAIHPVQTDVTGLRTKDLVDRIRCETRLAIEDKAIDLLRNVTDDPSGRSQQLADYLGAHREVFLTINPAQLPTAKERTFYNTYINTGVAYDFTFDITEDDKAAAAADPLRLVTNGMVGAALGASGEFKRENVRHFIVSETFGNLLHNKELPCTDYYEPENFAYPISGKVGMAELISTFIDLNRDKQLTADPKSNASAVFADTLTFTTTLIGSASPHIAITPVGRKLGLQNTSLTASGSRIDSHAMIVGLSMAPSTAKPSVTSGPLGASSSKSALSKDTVTPEERRALEAIVQQRMDNFYDRFGVFIAQ